MFGNRQTDSRFFNNHQIGLHTAVHSEEPLFPFYNWGHHDRDESSLSDVRSALQADRLHLLWVSADGLGVHPHQPSYCGLYQVLSPYLYQLFHDRCRLRGFLPFCRLLSRPRVQLPLLPSPTFVYFYVNII